MVSPSSWRRLAAVSSRSNPETRRRSRSGETWSGVAAHVNAIYRQLDITLSDEHIIGESFYNPLLPATVKDLLDGGVATESDGAVIVASPRFSDPDGKPSVLLVRKSDGGYGYATTDLATIRYRAQELKADRLIYVTDARQSQHFAMVFDAAESAGWLGTAAPEHAPFGAMLGDDGRPFKTRSGGTVALQEPLESALERARAIVDQRNPELPEAERAAVATAVGIGAVKYADLSTSRQRDLVFDFDRMLALDGNTAPYMLYACVRAASIKARANERSTTVQAAEPIERTLVLKLGDYGDTPAAAHRHTQATPPVYLPVRARRPLTAASTRAARCSTPTRRRSAPRDSRSAG